ncbi:MAG: cyclic nucleotide-binding domain-containing protein [Mariprofundaceae bacterium]|nr:cyclic nucleotide-binding domain-containing protein [Mariprofundaceae bacterium]
MSDEFTEETHVDFDGKFYPILAVLFPDELHFFRSIATVVELAADVAILSEGEVSPHLYLVQSGVLRVNKRHGNEIFEVGSITPGEVFSEASVLYNSPAGAEVRTIEPSVLYQIPADQVRDVLASNERFNRSISQIAERRAAASALAVNPIFATLPQVVREVALYNGQFITIDAGDTLMSEGSADIRFMFIVLSGEAEISMQHPGDPKKKIVVARASSGDEIGEISVITGKPHAATVVATTTLRLMVLNNDSIQAWRKRYSDFGYALYACVQHKLQHSLEALRNIVDDEEAHARTIGTLPPLKRQNKPDNSK